MKNKMKTSKAEKTIVLSQIFILIVAVFAFAWLIGGIPGVNASGGGTSSNPKCDKIGGSCIDTSLCKSAGGKSTALLCNGPSNIQCCTGIDFSTSNSKGAYESIMQKLGPITTVPQTYTSLKELIAGKKLSPSDPVKVTDPNLLPKVYSPGTLGEGFLGSGYSALELAGAAAVASGFSYLGQQIGGDGVSKDLIGATLGAGATLGYFAWVAGGLGPVGWAIAGATFVVNLFISHTKEEGVVMFYCQPWDAATGGQNCDACNNQNIPCSEYQCKSLGQSCEFVQSDNTTGNSFCFWNSRNDVTPPIIRPNEADLTLGYRYVNSTAVSPPDRGVKIIANTTDGCLTPYTSVNFGVNVDEPAKCKIDFQNQPNYDSMAQYFGGSSTRKFNHTQTLVIPELNQTLGKDNSILAYVRCQDSNGNADTANFVFEMCVQKGPDTTAPTIYGTSIANGAKVPFNVTQANVDFYVNEPANCKWSFKDQNYADMENNMTCATNATQMNLRASYTCNTNLTGIKVVDQTNYFVRCQDVSPQNNTNAQSYKYSLSSSSALRITKVTPNETTILDSTSPATVTLTATTLGGTYDGKAVCYSGTTTPGSNEISYKIFDNTGSSNQHSTDLHLYTGNYTYFVKCDDLGGNSDTQVINFNVSIDSASPLIARAYYTNNNQMKIITNEKAECEYSLGPDGANVQFGDGKKATSSADQLTFTLPWDTLQDLCVKCQDIYGNKPAAPDKCSISLRAQK